MGVLDDLEAALAAKWQCIFVIENGPRCDQRS